MEKKFFLEVNIFNIKKNLYKKKLEDLFFKIYRRDKNLKFIAINKQMNKDVIFAKKGLKAKLVI